MMELSFSHPLPTCPKEGMSRPSLDRRSSLAKRFFGIDWPVWLTPQTPAARIAVPGCVVSAWMLRVVMMMALGLAGNATLDADEPDSPPISLAEFLKSVSSGKPIEPAGDVPQAASDDVSLTEPEPLDLLQLPEDGAAGGTVSPQTENPVVNEPLSNGLLSNELLSNELSSNELSSNEPWWESLATGFLLDSPQYVSFDLPTILTDTLDKSPKLSAVSRRTSIAFEKIVQQDAVFDPTLLLEGGYGRINDPVGNTLTTGGPDRLIQNTFTSSGGFRKLTRRGAIVDLSQDLGTQDSNSIFFLPNPQGNSRLSLSITQPLLATSGEVYNTRLVTQASIDSYIAWEQMRTDIESHLVETFTTFWRLYERRCHLVQQRALLEREQRIAGIVDARADFDSGPLQRIKVQRRLAADRDRIIEIETDIQRLQVQLRALVGTDVMASIDGGMELIPEANPDIPSEDIDLRDAIVRGLEHRPDVLAATRELAAAGLGINVTRNELKPQLDAVFDAYLAGLRGDNRFFQAFGDQFSAGGPGLTATLQYSLPYGRRAARSRLREARYRYQQRSEELRESLLTARREIESTLIQSKASFQLRQSRAATLAATAREEAITLQRWELLAGDGGPTALILEDLLETQKRRTEAEQGFVSAQVNAVLSLIQLQRAMGTLLMAEGVQPVRPGRTSRVEIMQTDPLDVQHLTAPIVITEPTEYRPDGSFIEHNGMIEVEPETTSTTNREQEKP